MPFILLVNFMSGLSFTPVGDLPGDSFDSMIYGISGDGRIAVGRSSVTGIRTYSSEYEAFYWSQLTGIVGIGDLDSERIGSTAFSVNFDGSVIVGQGDTNNGYSGTIWNMPDLNPSSLGDNMSVYQVAKDVSNDGSVVVGYTKLSTMSYAPFGAFRWTSEDGLIGLGSLPGGSSGSEAEAVSGDGNVIVGFSGSSNSGSEAFKWTQSEGMTGLGDLPGGSFQSRAYDVNVDGSVVVGEASSQTGSEAFMWTQDIGMVGLGFTVANAVSTDGNIVVGYSNDDAIVWDPINGKILLEEHLSSEGIDLSGWQLVSATDISDDGSVIVGYGTNSNGDTEGFIISGYVVPMPPLLPVVELETFYESNTGEIITVDATPVDGFPTTYSYQWYFKAVGSSNYLLIPENVGGTTSNYQIGYSHNDGTWKVEVTNETGTSFVEFEYRVFTDSDSDTLSDGRERFVLGTDPNDIDSDDDSLADNIETNTGFWVSSLDTGTDPLSNDSDGDGLYDGFETNTGTYVSPLDTGTDPNNQDSDDDGLIDGVESGSGTYVNNSDTGTNPLNVDSDSDGILDSYETASGIWQSAIDTGTDPNKGDSDGDMLSDGVETNTGAFADTSDTGTNPHTADTDGDGFTDYYEVYTNYDPTNLQSTPDALLTVKTAIELEFHGATGGTYRIEHSTNLEVWSIVEDNILGESALIERLHSIDDYSVRFFRVIRTN